MLEPLILSGHLLVLAAQAYLAWRIFHAGRTLQNRIKAADTSIRCQERYEALLDTRRDIRNVEEVERYFDRFWNAQADQFVHWKNDLIPDETYLDWMLARRRQFLADKPLLTGADAQASRFRASWTKRYTDYYQYRPFGRFLADIFTHENSGGADMLADLEKIKAIMDTHKSAPALLHKPNQT